MAGDNFTANTSTFNVVAGNLSQLVVTTQPPNVITIGQSFGLTITAEDAYNNVISGFSGSVTLALVSNPGNSTLSGTTTITAVNGVAVFTSLTLNQLGSGYTLDAVSGSFTSLPTNAFTVGQTAAFTSASNAAFAVETSGHFTVTASGFPAPALSESGTDTLPGGVTFNPATGVLSGTPAVGSGGAYTLHFIAHNGVGSDATQTVTLFVDTPPVVVGAFVSSAAWNSGYLAVLVAAGLGSSAGFELASGAVQLTTMVPWNNVTTLSLARAKA